MRQTSTKVQSCLLHPSHTTRAVLSQGSHVLSVPSACPGEARSRHRVINDFRLSRLSCHVLGTPAWSVAPNAPGFQEQITEDGSGNYRRLPKDTEGRRRIPKDTESYRRLPKAGLKIEYRPIVDPKVAAVSLRKPQWVQGWSGVRGRSSSEAESFFVFGYPKLSFVGSFSAVGSPRVESLVETFAPLAEPILSRVQAGPPGLQGAA